MENKIVVSEEKISGLRSKHLGVDLVEVLTAPTPKEHILSRKARGGREVEYIPGYFFIQRLNDAFGFLWSFEALEHIESNGQIIIKGQVTAKIPGKTLVKRVTYPDGRIEEEYQPLVVEIKKTQYGGCEVKKYSDTVMDRDGKTVKYAKNSPIDIGDDYKSAATDAFKKCGTQFGIGLQDVYGPREKVEEGAVSKVQLEVFYSRAQKAGLEKLEAEEWASKELGEPFESLQEIDILGLIPKLIKKAKEASTR